MKRLVRLTESELKSMIKKAISEQETTDTLSTTAQPTNPLPKDTDDTFWGEGISVDGGIATQMAIAAARIKFKQNYFKKHQKVPDKDSFVVVSKNVSKIDDKNYKAVAKIKEKTF